MNKLWYQLPLLSGRKCEHLVTPSYPKLAISFLELKEYKNYCFQLSWVCLTLNSVLEAVESILITSEQQITKPGYYLQEGQPAKRRQRKVETPPVKPCLFLLYNSSCFFRCCPLKCLRRFFSCLSKCLN